LPSKGLPPIPTKAAGSRGGTRECAEAAAVAVTEACNPNADARAGGELVFATNLPDPGTDTDLDLDMDMDIDMLLSFVAYGVPGG